MTQVNWAQAHAIDSAVSMCVCFWITGRPPVGRRPLVETRMIGPLANSAALILGGAIGAALSSRIPARVR